jgi:hypothetical protein
MGRFEAKSEKYKINTSELYLSKDEFPLLYSLDIENPKNSKIDFLNCA